MEEIKYTSAKQSSCFREQTQCRALKHLDGLLTAQSERATVYTFNLSATALDQ